MFSAAIGTRNYVVGFYQCEGVLTRKGSDWEHPKMYIYIYVYILILYIYIGQPRGVFKGSCHCNPSQELGHSWIQFEEQMFQTDFLHTKNARRKCLKHQRQRRFFVRWGFGSNFGAFDVRPKISGGGTTTDFSRWCFQFFFMFTPTWRSGPI